MLTLDNNSLWFDFPEVHRSASCAVAFNRTLRIPEHDQRYPLPPKLGAFPLSVVDDHTDRLSSEPWRVGLHDGLQDYVVAPSSTARPRPSSASIEKLTVSACNPPMPQWHRCIILPRLCN